jgi:REP element-mobilizing transposase RayT
MGRALRFHQPGSAFHIVSRTQGHEPWFSDEMKDAIATTLLTGVAAAGARPIGFAIMDNHFHLLLFQGRAPLGEVMQPALRRIALIVQKSQGRVGHIFERRFRAKVCHDSEHLPNAILYVHRNPVAAKMCKTPEAYRWSSARAFEGTVPPGLLCVDDALRVFDANDCGSPESMRAAYRERLHGCPSEVLDGYWAWFCRSVRRRGNSRAAYVPTSPHASRASVRDVRDVALEILRTIDSDIDHQHVRSRYGGARVVAARTQLIAALDQRGYPGVAIARFLRISESTVSRIRSGMRWGMSESLNVKKGQH